MKVNTRLLEDLPIERPVNVASHFSFLERHVIFGTMSIVPCFNINVMPEIKRNSSLPVSYEVLIPKRNKMRKTQLKSLNKVCSGIIPYGNAD